MQTNGITVPDAGVTKEYIVDKTGGWVYEVTTTIVVEQNRLADFKEKQEDVRRQISKLQDVLVATAPVEAQIDSVVEAKVDEVK